MVFGLSNFHHRDGELNYFFHTITNITWAVIIQKAYFDNTISANDTSFGGREWVPIQSTTTVHQGLELDREDINLSGDLLSCMSLQLDFFRRIGSQLKRSIGFTSIINGRTKVCNNCKLLLKQTNNWYLLQSIYRLSGYNTKSIYPTSLQFGFKGNCLHMPIPLEETLRHATKVLKDLGWSESLAEIKKLFCRSEQGMMRPHTGRPCADNAVWSGKVLLAS